MGKAKKFQTKVIGLGNQKGGVGKTTNTVHIAAALGEKGYKVLVWDLDAGAGSTKHLGIPLDAYPGTYHIYSGDRESDEVILTNDDPDITLPKNVDFIASTRELEDLERTLPGKKDPFFIVHELLQEPIKKLRGRYDFILLDTSPNASIGTKCSYISSDYYILSVVPERLPIEGMKDALGDLRCAQQPGRNPGLKLLGVIVSGFDKRIRRAREYNEKIEESFAQLGQKSSLGAKFQESIKRAAAVSRACDQGKTIFDTEPNHPVAEQFRKIGDEVLFRIGEYEKLSSKKTAKKKEVING